MILSVMAAHELCHVEYLVTDIDRAMAFYKSVFDWDFQQFTDSMVVFGYQGKHIGGLQKVDSVSAGASPSLWFEVSSLEESVAKGLAAGGTLLKDRHPVPGVGFAVVLADQDGNEVGLVLFAQ